MSPDPELRIAPLDSTHADAVRSVAFRTGFLGESLEELLDDARIFTRSLDPFLKNGKSAGSVLLRDGEVTGYCIASLGDVTIPAVRTAVGGALFDLVRWARLSARDRRWWRRRMAAGLRALRGEERSFRIPGGSALHINLLPSVRNAGVGSALLQTTLSALRSRGVTLVHANSYQDPRHPTEAFWLRNGFAPVSSVRSSAWADLLPELEVRLVCYAREP